MKQLQPNPTRNMKVVTLIQRILVSGIAARLLMLLRKRMVATMQPPCEYLESLSGKRYQLSIPRWCADEKDKNGQPIPLMLTDLPGIKRSQIDVTKRSLWRYSAAFPIKCEHPISMGEGCTPLISRRVLGATVYFKCEWHNPTCSFKDRGASVMLSLLRQQGIKHVLEDSSGNGGASIASYAAAGGMQATIMAPQSTSPAKTVQMRAHGAAVELIPGSRQDTADAAVAAHGRDGGEVFYASHNWHPFFLQGTKTIAYEMWEDLGFQAPDNVIIPTGAGSNVLGCHLGFSELLRVGEIKALPRLFCVQPLLCSPIASAVQRELGEDDGKLAPAAWNTPEKTMAEGTSIMQPVRQMECVQAVKVSRGGATRVTEDEMAQATLELAQMGLYAEPTCAQAYAAFKELHRSRKIDSSQRTVLILTSTGIKATPILASLLGVRL